MVIKYEIKYELKVKLYLIVFWEYISSQIEWYMPGIVSLVAVLSSINQFKANIDNIDIVDLQKVLGDMKKLNTLY